MFKLVQNIKKCVWYVNNEKQTFRPQITGYSKSRFHNKADELALWRLSKDSTVSKCLFTKR